MGAKDGEVVVTDTTSVNLFKVLAAALRKQQAAAPHKRVIVSERRNFPTDLYIAQGLIDQLHAHGAPAPRTAPDRRARRIGPRPKTWPCSCSRM